MPADTQTTRPLTDPAARADAECAAKVADERARLARDVADRARQTAKSARREAANATAEADDLREVADPELAIRHSLTPDQAKARLMEAARDFDPLRGVRESVKAHPFVLVGTAAVSGAVLGSTGKAILGLSALTGSIVKLARPLALAAAQFAAAKVAAKSAAQDVAEDVGAAPTPSHTAASSATSSREQSAATADAGSI